MQRDGEPGTHAASKVPGLEEHSVDAILFVVAGKKRVVRQNGVKHPLAPSQLPQRRAECAWRGRCVRCTVLLLSSSLFRSYRFVASVTSLFVQPSVSFSEPFSNVR